MKLIDLTGKKFNSLLVLERISNTNPIKWKCLCDCGNIVEVQGRYLRENHTKSCGCLKRITAKTMGEKTKKDLTNKIFNYLTVIKDSEQRRKTEVIWECKCECGNITYVSGLDLTQNKIKSCGCKKTQLNSEKHTIPMIGKTFGKLTVIKIANQHKDGSYNYLCKCDCGNQKIINGCNLRSGTTTSCGCIQYSIGETKIKQLLDKNNISYKKEYSIPELNNKRFDFAILNKDKVIRFIEFDGRQHFEESNSIWEKSSTLKERQQRDKEKNQYAISHNIPLVRIPYWERDNITLEMIMGDKYLVGENL